MTDDLGRPWWEFDPDERPVPLTEEEVAVSQEAERIVLAERQAMARQDTDPTLETLAALREASRAEVTEREVREGLLGRPVAASAITLLLAGCLVMFALGWKQGASTRTRTQPSLGGPQSVEVMQTTSSNGLKRSTEGLVSDQQWRPRDEEVSKR